MAARSHDIADGDAVLQQDEEPGDDVLHQGLRAEADGEAGDTHAGEHRRDVEADLGEDHQRRDHADDDAERVACKRQQRAGALAALHQLAPLVDLSEVAVDEGRYHLQHDDGDDGDGDDGSECGDHGPARIAREPGEDVGVPCFEDEAEAQQQDHRLRRPARDRQVAVDPRLQPRIALVQLGADAEAPLEGAPGAGDAEARGPGDDDRRGAPLDQEEEARRPLRSRQQPAGDDVEDRRDVPEIGELAEKSKDPEVRPRAAGPPGLVQPARERRAVLQDESDEEPDQEDAEQPHQRGIAALRQAQQQRRLAEDVAIGPDVHQAPPPDRAVGGVLVRERGEAELRRVGRENQGARRLDDAHDQVGVDDRERDHPHRIRRRNDGEDAVGHAGRDQVRRRPEQGVVEQQQRPEPG